MNVRKFSCTLKVVMTCILVAMVCLIYVGDTAYAYEKDKKKSESCYLAYVKAEANGETYTFRGSLKPVGVPADSTWTEYFEELKVTNFNIVNTGYCGKNHKTVTMYIYIDGEWKEIMSFEKTDEGYLKMDSIDTFEFTEDYYDIKFGFSNSAGPYTSTCLYARFAKEYSVFYELNGGKFVGGSVDAYTTGADYKIPEPVKTGYEFAGWTGTGLTEATKDLVIKNGTTGNVKYTANWIKVGGDEDPTSGTKIESTTTAKAKVEAPAQTKVKSATKKLLTKKAKLSIKKIKGAAGYKVQFSTTKKFKKVLVTKTVKKANATIKHKKLKNKKKLFVRAKAYKLDGKTKVWAAKWSKAKKVKIK